MRSGNALALALLILRILTFAQVRKDPPNAVAGIPVNYDEAKVGNYVLPDPLDSE